MIRFYNGNTKKKNAISILKSRRVQMEEKKQTKPTLHQKNINMF